MMSSFKLVCKKLFLIIASKSNILFKQQQYHRPCLIVVVTVKLHFVN